MHAQADTGEGLGRSQGDKRQRKESVQALYRVYLVQFPYLELFCVKGHFFTFGRNQFHTFLGEISEKKTPCRSSHDHGKASQFF